MTGWVHRMHEQGDVSFSHCGEHEYDCLPGCYVTWT